jgi:hypothetical protein
MMQACFALRLRALPALSALCVASALAACSPTGSTGTTPGGTGAAGGSAGSSGTAGTSGTLNLDGGGSGGGNGCPPCSTDLKKVIDCDGNVIEECGAGQACADGACIDDPCEAAVVAQTTSGCDYWTIKTDTLLLTSCFAIMVANTWPENVHIKLERGGTEMNLTSFTRIPKGQGASISYEPFDPALGLPPDEVAILFISFVPGGLAVPCPAGITPALATDPSAFGTSIGQAFHITTDAPVVSYQIYPYGGGNVAQTSATLLLPTPAWRDNYVAVNPGHQAGIPSIDIIADQDDTEVTINPKVAIAAGQGVPGSPAGTPVTYALKRGEYLQISQFDELTGSAIQANKPVGVFGAAGCLNVPASACCCDTAHQQTLGVRALGNEYAAVRYRSRQTASSEESVPWRLVGVVDGTELAYEPTAPAGAPSIVGLGDAVEFWTPDAFLVRSQDPEHPFYLGGYMTGCEHIAPSGLEGDAEWVNVVPTAQYRESYVFFSDVTYPETNLVLVRTKKDGKAADVELDCAGVLGGWTPLGDYEYARFDLVTGGVGPGTCGNGRHVISSSLPFGLTVWGWGNDFATQAVSYAYPAGQGLAPVNDVVVPPVPR